MQWCLGRVWWVRLTRGKAFCPQSSKYDATGQSRGETGPAWLSNCRETWTCVSSLPWICSIFSDSAVMAKQRRCWNLELVEWLCIPEWLDQKAEHKPHGQHGSHKVYFYYVNSSTGMFCTDSRRVNTFVPHSPDRKHTQCCGYELCPHLTYTSVTGTVIPSLPFSAAHSFVGFLNYCSHTSFIILLLSCPLLL